MSQTLGATLPAQTAAGGTSTTNAGVIGSVQGTNNAIRKIWITYAAGASALTADAANNVTIEVGRVRAGVRTVIGSLTTNVGNGLTAQTPKAIPLAVTTTNGTKDVTASLPGDLIDVKLIQNASGVAVAAGAKVEIEVE